eukprot:CAMPEP_0184490364 /NCGR_PEP_ID=MMETSP0113_2-20130426/17714_1 /TAXON_ID=91329 /ORGANISM="Norrisiella sphaerica, Strain BC52" /LENGTH=273 /DNA_ID=CAMNT_0026874219 /DNA_START=1 /DNA_END=822 /DNA_ORIENTATION=+
MIKVTASILIASTLAFANPAMLASRTGRSGLSSARATVTSQRFAGRSRQALSDRSSSLTRRGESISKSSSSRLIAKAQETQNQSPPIPLIAPPIALAAAYAIIKASPLDQALTGFIEGNGYPQMFRDLNFPGFFYNWFHAANMAIVAGAMGGYGAWLGFETKAGRGNEEAWGSLNGATKRELHAQLMAGAGLIFAAGGLGGVTFMLTLQKPLFESPHAVTGLAELMLFATQASLALAMKKNPELREAHANLGKITMGILAFHAALGVKLGLGL